MGQFGPKCGQIQEFLDHIGPPSFASGINAKFYNKYVSICELCKCECLTIVYI